MRIHYPLPGAPHKGEGNIKRREDVALALVGGVGEQGDVAGAF